MGYNLTCLPMPPHAIDIPASSSARDAVGDLVRLPRYISGQLPDIHGYGRRFKMYVAHHLIDKIHEAFLVKSDGGTDETGMKWKPLKRETIAQRPLAPGEATELKIRNLGRGGRGLLTLSQNRKWKGIFASVFKRMLLKVGEAEAKRIAARTAWAILKADGAKTKLDVLGNRHVKMLQVSLRLIKSLEPGHLSDDAYSPPKEQIFQSHWGAVTIGTKVPYAEFQHRMRPLWPDVSAMNRAGWTSSAAKEGMERLISLVRSG